MLTYQNVVGEPPHEGKKTMKIKCLRPFYLKTQRVDIGQCVEVDSVTAAELIGTYKADVAKDADEIPKAATEIPKSAAQAKAQKVSEFEK